MNSFLSRRLVIGGLAGAVLSRGAVVRASEARHAITVGCWGGAYAEALAAVVDGPLARNASIAVHQSISDEQARVAHVASPGGASVLDVAMLSDVDAYRLSLGQIFTPVTTAGVGSLTQVMSGLRTPYGVPQGTTALCITYNPGKSGSRPQGFKALFEAARKGKVGFSSELAIHNLAAAAIAQRDAGASLETAKSTFLALKKARNLRIYPTNEALGQAIASGEVTMAPMWRSRTHVWQKSGMDVRSSIPGEGAIPFTILACVPKGSQSTASAMLYLDALLHSGAQVEMASRLGLLPTVKGVRIDEKLLGQIGFDARQKARFRPLSFDAVARNGVGLRHFWDDQLV